MKWLKVNKLSLNAGKTELIFFHSKQRPLNYDISIKFNDKFLSWSFHVFQLSKKLSRANGILSKLRHHAPIEICLQVYYAILYSHLMVVIFGV